MDDMSILEQREAELLDRFCLSEEEKAELKEIQKKLEQTV